MWSQHGPLTPRYGELTSTLLPASSRTTRETPLPRTRPRRSLLLLQVNAFKSTSRHINFQLPQIGESPRDQMLLVGHVVAVGESAKQEGPPSFWVRDDLAFCSVCRETPSEDLFPGKSRRIEDECVCEIREAIHCVLYYGSEVRMIAAENNRSIQLCVLSKN